VIILVIKIQTEETFIPIEFGKLKFKFDTSDESIQSFYKSGEETMKEIESISAVEGEEIETVKAILKKGYDTFLGDGAFEKIYKQTPSVINLSSYFIQLSQSITEEIENMGLTESQQTKVDKYLQNKKK